MIRISRGDEPLELAVVRRKELAKAVLAWSSQQKIGFDGYQCVKFVLFDRQNRKCAWCERIPGPENQPVEHYRPKGGAHDGDVDKHEVIRTDSEHYWWLAWTWSNLLFSCSRCNGNWKDTKGNWFPIKAGTSRAVLPPKICSRNIPATVSTEDSLLLNPAHDDPMDAIVWLPLDPKKRWAELKWIPNKVNGDDRGYATIKIFQLDTNHALDVSDDICANIVPKIERIERAIGQRDVQTINEAMDELEKLFAPTLPFLAARYDAWMWFKAHSRLQGLDALTMRGITKPGCPADTTRDLPIPPDEPECVHLTDRLVLRLRAEDFTNVLDAVVSLCTEGITDPQVIQRLTSYKTIAVVRRAVKRWQLLVAAMIVGKKYSELALKTHHGADVDQLLKAMEKVGAAVCTKKVGKRQWLRRV